MEGITLKFPLIFRKIFIIYYNAVQNVVQCKIEKYLFFFTLILFNFFELSKSIFNGLVNQTFYRLLLSNFICSFKSQQVLFDFSFSLTYVFMIILSFKVLFSCRYKTHVFNKEYLNFLDQDTDKKLRKEHHFRRKEIREYFSSVNFLVKFESANIIVFFIGCFIGMMRVIYFAFYNLPLNLFIFYTIPNVISLSITFIVNYYITCVFYLIYYLNCIFLVKKLESLSSKKNLLQETNSSRWTFNFNALQSLADLNQILKQIHYAQKDINNTIAGFRML